MTDDRQLEAMLRDGMSAEARPVMADSALTERIISAANSNGGAAADSRLWQNWLMPAVAATLVALLIGSVLFGTKLLHSSGPSPATHQSPSLSAPVTSPPPSASHTPKPSASTAPSTGPASSPTIGGPVPDGFQGYELTWVSADEGWALGTAPCTTLPCTSIVRTTDGGQHWIGLPTPKAFLLQHDNCNIGCSVVSSIRFVSPEVGYVFGPNAFYLTTDGGETWQSEPGNALGLELAGSKVVRLSTPQPYCAPGCKYEIQRADVGSTSWQTVTLPAGGQSDNASLSASGNNVVLMTNGNPAGGASNAQSVVFSSTDAGATWSKLGEPCPQASSEIDSTALSVAGNGSIAVLCRARMGGAMSLAVSTGPGAPFTTVAAIPESDASVVTAANSSTVLVGGTHLYRWDGSTLTAVAGPSAIEFAGFESDQVGRVLANNGIWMTSDGGRNWTQLSY